ncbi:MAG: hypothetical protein AB7P03_03200 [Kofleriaceae bacterium]
MLDWGRRLGHAALKNRDGRLRGASRELWSLAIETAFQSSSARLVGEAKGQAKALLEAAPGIAQHLQATPHFGILQDLVPVRLTRFDYVALQISSALKLKKSIPGLGLSATIQVGKQRISGLELLQLWAVLISAGHLFGTFATERALSYRLQATPAALDEFLRTLPANLAINARTKITAGGMNEFVNVLAIWRVVHEQLHAELRSTCLEALAMYLRPPADAKERRLYDLHRRIRQASYQRLQGACAVPSRKTEFAQVGFVSIGASAEDFFDRDDISFDPRVDEATPMFRLMQAVDEFQFRSFFTSEDANRLVLDHLLQFKDWWRDADARGTPVDERVHALRTRPANWPGRTGDSLGRRVLRLDLPRNQPWFQTVRGWLAPATWDHSNFLLTEVVGTKLNICDIFSTTQLSTRECSHVAEMLCAVATHSDGPHPARSIARFGLLVLGYCLNDGVRPQLEPLPSGGSHGLATIARSFAELAQQVAKFAKETGGDRGRELDASLHQLMEMRPPDDGVWLSFLGRVVLNRGTEDDQETVQEFDGLFLRLTATSARWFAFEHKVAGQGGAAKQLAKLKSLLEVTVVDEGEGVANGTIAWLVFTM